MIYVVQKCNNNHKNNCLAIKCNRVENHFIGNFVKKNFLFSKKIFFSNYFIFSFFFPSLQDNLGICWGSNEAVDEKFNQEIYVSGSILTAASPSLLSSGASNSISRLDVEMQRCVIYLTTADFTTARNKCFKKRKFCVFIL